METLKKYAKNKWVWVMVVAAAGLASGEVFSGGKFSDVLLIILGQG
jgi:hypothetical protein